MSTKENMQIGIEIAEKHMKNVMEISTMGAFSTEEALRGCIVSLAGDIMIALDRQEKEKAPEVGA